MRIGIDASRAFLKNRTGIEEYSYQIIKNLRDNLEGHQVVLYLRKNQSIDYDLPDNWIIKVIKWPRFWTQIGLSLEMLFNKVDVLLIPAHTVPVIHPKNTVVVVHGLEYEFCPEAYSSWERFYMRFSIKNSCKWASKIISVSENTKKDLMRLYDVLEEKITVVYEGYGESNQKSVTGNRNNFNRSSYELLVTSNNPFFLFIGRIETRKNIANVVKAFEIFKEKNKTNHKLVLAGRPGYGFENIKLQITNSKFKDDIVELGYIAEEEKWELLKNADAFVFATLYEGFGIPVLEAQSTGCPVIASNNSSIPEVVRDSALMVDPNDIDVIADAMGKLATNEEFKKDLVDKGLENTIRFSWSKCAKEISDIIQRQL